jgi:transposase
VHRQCTAAWALDEGRFGLKVWFRRRWCPVGVRPLWEVADQYQWRWLYLAVEPSTGASFALLLPGTDSACLQVFLDAFVEGREQERIGLVLDQSGAHRSDAITWPASIDPLPLPAYSPELNPVERLFQELRARLANRIFENLAALDDALAAVLREYWTAPARLAQLTDYGWWLAGSEDIQPSAS